MRAGVVIMVGYCKSRLNIVPADHVILSGCSLALMRSVPRRGSGWVCRLAMSIANQETHPLPRGGTDLISRSVPGVHCVHVHLAGPQSQKQFPGNGMIAIELIEHVRLGVERQVTTNCD
jgi:hypothetical protein